MTRRILAAIAALLIAAVGALAAVSYAKNADRRALAGQQAVSAYVAVKPVPAGTTAGKAVKEGLIARQLIARKGVPDGVLTAVDGSYDQLVAASDIQPGELVMRTRFAVRGATEGSLLVPEGQLAVTVALDDPSHVGPFLVVGSKVAIFDTFNIQEANATDVTPAGDRLQDRHEYDRSTRLLLPSVEVLAIGSTTTSAPSQDSPTGQPLGATTPSATTLVTLAVNQDQAQRLVHGSRTGTLTLALIGPSTTATPGKGIDDKALFEAAK